MALLRELVHLLSLATPSKNNCTSCRHSHFCFWLSLACLLLLAQHLAQRKVLPPVLEEELQLDQDTQAEAHLDNQVLELLDVLEEAPPGVLEEAPLDSQGQLHPLDLGVCV